MIFRNVGVEYSKPADHLAPDIRKERIFYFVGLAKPLQNFARVIGYRGGIYSVRFEAFERELQLDELVAAVGSPISAAAEDQQQPVRSGQIVQRPNLTVLVGEGKIGHPLANVRSGPITVILCLDKLQPVLRRDMVPVKLGLKNVKAITKLTYVAQEPRDYWAERGYSRYDGI